MKTTIRSLVFSIVCVFTLSCIFPLHTFAQADACSAPTAISSATTCIDGTSRLTGQTLKSKNTSSPNVAASGTCTGTPGIDVWFSFVAKTTNPTIALSSIGTSLRGSTGGTKIQVLRGTCPSGFTPVNCISGTGSTLDLNPTLTVGLTYFIRIYTNATSTATGNATAWGFTICVTDPVPANNNCNTAISLTSVISPAPCVTTPGNIYGATGSAPTIITTKYPNCTGTAINDVWYSFVAQTQNPTISLTNLTAGFTNPGIQLLLPVKASDPCGTDGFETIWCGTTSIAADFLTPGTTYYIRVFSTSASITNGAYFDICIADPVTPAPSNDECAGAVNISVSSACNNLAGDMAGATPSAIPLHGSCPGTLVYDVWYKFTAVNNTATIDVSGMGTNFLNPAIQVFTGNCGTLTPFACGADPLAMTGTLTAGTTYYVRVYSRTAPLPKGNARFNICITSSLLPVVRFGNSYVNISKKTTGGVVQPGDTLEIRMTINHTVATTMTNLRFVDNIPTKTTMLTGAGNFLKVITNEGLTYKQYTTAADSDPGTYLPSPLPANQFNIRMNLGFGTSNPGTPPDNTATNITTTNGSMLNTNRPTVFGNALLFAVAYRVKVTGVVGDTIVLSPARFIYRTGGSDVTLTATSYKILISNPLSLCTNSIGLNNAVEVGGTFGTGTGLNRGTDLTTPIPGYSFANDVNTYNHLGDGRYAIVNNISPRSRTNRNANKVPSCGVVSFGDVLNCNNRMHNGHWYIDGDHTGTSTTVGNVPPDETTNAGYMLMVNADYVASEVYTQTLTNLCPNTYYEFSAWYRNICRTCGGDSTGAQFAGTPTSPANGYPGVYPNLSFALNGLDYYSTGEIDTIGWVKKGFVFRTDTAQTNATFSIRNNSQGGGGNDWVMDDIAVATCLPTMSYSPTINPNVCHGNAISIADTISSFFKNYTTYKWQRKVGAGPWTDITGVTTIPDTNYYITTYTVPPGNTTMLNNGDLYRVVVATTASNLTNPNCNISDGVTITLTVNDCGVPLKSDLLSFNGRLVSDKGNLSWTTSKEEEPIIFTVERSTDGNNFTSIGSVNSLNNYMAATNAYSFIDPVPVTGKVFYRLLMKDQSGAKKYSRTIQLSRAGSETLSLISVINPFNYSLEFDIAAQTETKIQAELLDLFGKVVIKNNYTVRTGINALSLPNTDILPSGTYILRIRSNEIFINRKVVKNAL